MNTDAVAYLLIVPVIVALATAKMEWYARYSSRGVFQSPSSRQFAGVLMSLIAAAVYAMTGKDTKEWRVAIAVFVLTLLSFWATRLFLRWFLGPQASGDRAP